MTNALMAPSIDPNKNNTKPNSRRVKFGQLLCSSEPNVLSPLLNDVENEDVNCSGSGSGNSSRRLSNVSDCYTSSPRLSYEENPTASPFYYAVSPFNQTDYSPYIKSPWIKVTPNQLGINHHTHSIASSVYYSRGRDCLIGSLVREEGHVYSLAVHDGTLYTGSESKNIRVWKDFHDVGGFKCGNGLVKAIVVSSTNGKVFTGHQDGKIRVWSETGKRVGSLPKLKDFIKSSINPKNYVEVRRHHKVPRIKHYDAVSCMSLNEESGLLYSASWDKTIKVWRINDGKCLESIEAHSDAINSIVVGFGGLVVSGSADGTIKVWRRELMGRTTKHFHVKTLLSQENAVTSLAVSIMDGGDGGDVEEVLYSGSSDGLVNFWVREKEEVVYGGVLRGHKLAVLCLATAGCLVFSGSADKSICVWRREDGGAHSCLAVLTGHYGPVKCIAVEKDRHCASDSNSDSDSDDYDHHGSRQWIVYSGSLDKSVRIWRVSEYAPEVDESVKSY